MKLTKIFGVLLFVIGLVSPAFAGEIFGDGTDGLHVSNQSGNVGVFGMFLDPDHYYGLKSVKFSAVVYQSGSAEVTKTLPVAVPRSSYMECMAFVRLPQLEPAVSNVFVKTTFYIGNGTTFCEVGPLIMHRGVMGGNWGAVIIPVQGQNPPAMVTAIKMKFEYYFSGTPSNDSIRCEIKWDYWNFSSFSYPQIIINDFEGNVSGIEPISETAERYSLDQNYPNPFNPKTNIRFSVPEREFVTLSIYDALGKEVEKLISEEMNAGTYVIDWNASQYASGVYFCRMQAGNFIDVKRMTLVK